MRNKAQEIGTDSEGVAGCAPSERADPQAAALPTDSDTPSASARRYWARQLSGLPQVHNLPTERQRPAQLDAAAEVVHTHIDADTLSALRALCATEQADLLAGLQAAFAVLLARHSGEHDIVVGVPLALRAGVAVVRNDVTPQHSFREQLAQSAGLLRQAHEYDGLTLAQLAELARAPLNPAHAPLFQLVLALDAPAVSAEPAAQHDLVLQVEQTPAGLSLAWRYASTLFDRAMIERVAAHFGLLLQAATTAPDQDVWQLRMMDDAERRTVLYDWNATAAAFDARPLDRLIAEQVQRTPADTALCWRETELTYAELDAAANRLAHHLRALGVGSGGLVGVCVERTPDLVVALLAIWKAGAAYVPLDPHYPQERIAFMLADSGAACVLTQQRTAAQVGDANKLVLDDAVLQQTLQQYPSAAPSPVGDADALAYLIYTSGSTGRPKGVAIEHRQAAAFVAWAQQVYDASALSGVLAATSICFDLSIFELFVPLCSGGRVVLVDNALDFDGIARARDLTLINTVPSAIKMLVEEDKVPAGVRIVNLAGEALPPSLVREIYRRTAVEAVYNLYGPSEDTTYSTGALMQRDAERAPIGKPLSNGQAYLLDTYLEPVPVGVVGEIYVAGAGVARGYWNRPELTAERFLRNPFIAEGVARMYRTGDLARWNESGELEYLGRTDHQIKLRGFRIELGEIQERLLALAAIDQALVMARDDARGDKQLVAYVVPAVAPDDARRLVEQCKAELSTGLPEFMVPSAFVVLETMPLTPNGKVDRSALPPPEFLHDETAHEEPETPLQKELAVLWQESLRLSRRVGAGDNFFELGGHSLLATRMLGRVQQLFGVTVRLKALFEAPTLREFAAAVARSKAPKLPPPRRVAREEKVPLTFMQRQLWFIHQLDEGSAHYHMQSQFVIDGELDVDALRTAVEQVVQRHESLRTVVLLDGDEPYQHVLDDGRPAFELIDLSALPPAQRGIERERQVQAEALRPFALDRDAMLRATVLRLDATQWHLLLTLHHIAGDGWSLDVLMNEVGLLYAAARSGTAAALDPLPLQYRDYAAWQREVLQGDTLAELAQYWSTQLADLPTLHRLPLDHARPAKTGLAAGVHRTRIDAAATQAFQQMCQERRASLSMGLQMVFAALLARHSGERDIAVGTPIANREQAEFAPMIGLFTNTVILRSRIDAQHRFVDLLEQGRRNSLDAYAFQQIPGEHLAERLQLERSLSHAALAQIVFALQNTLQTPLTLDGLSVSALPNHIPASAFELMVEVQERADGLALDWIYRSELFEAATIERLADHYGRLLQAVTEQPEQDIWVLPMLAPTEQRKLVTDWNATAADFVREVCVHELFEARCDAAPDAVAVVDGDVEISYAELDRRANACAEYLRDRGVGPGRIVALVLDRGVDMVAAALGTLKAGAAYLPIDPAYPAARTQYMLDDSRALLMLTTQDWVARSGVRHDRIVCVATDLPFAAAGSPQRRPSGARAGDPAYVIYTSGSTGEPKGVVNSHAGLANLCQWHTRYFRTGAGSRCTLMSSIAFDATVLELWPALLAGACLVALDDTTRSTPQLLGNLLRQQRISHCFMPTGLLEVMADVGGLDSEYLQVLSCGGDRLQRYCLPQQSKARLVNLYGPTEATVLATAYEVPRGRTPLIGKPISNVRVHILNPALQPQPVGVVGELHIGGACVGLGYLNADALTRERFIADPFSSDPAARLYRSGDLARVLADGNIEFVGRADHQIKLRGFRIELGEIENRLGALADVSGAIVQLREDVPGHKRLVGYVTTRSGKPAQQSSSEIHAELVRILPEYMLPQSIQVLEAFPLTSSGKIDRQRLPAPDDADGDADAAQPSTATEHELAAIWAELLHQEGIGVDVNFFNAGGHSLLVTRLIHLIAARLGRQATVRDVFLTPTIRGLATLLDQRGRDIDELGHAAASDGPFPLSPSQFRIWYTEQMRGPDNGHSVPIALSLRGRVDAALLERALNHVVAQHEMLRTHVVVDQGVPLQRTQPQLPVTLRCDDLSALEPAERELRLQSLLAAHAAQMFDVQQLPLFALQLLRLGQEEYRLHLNFHHIVFDGWSYTLFLEDLLAAYDTLQRGDQPVVRVADTNYAGFVRRQREWQDSADALAQTAFWRNYLTDCSEHLSLPGLRRRHGDPASAGSRVVELVGPDCRNGLTALARSHQSSLFSVLYSAFAVLLGRLAAQDDFNIGIPVSGRHLPGVQGLIGNFLNNLPVRNRLDLRARFSDYLDAQIRNVQDVLSHQDLAFEKILELLPQTRSRDSTPLFQVFFNMLSLPEAAAPSSLNLVFEGGAEISPKFDLTLYVAQGEHGIAVTGHFNEQLFGEGAIERLLQQYAWLLEQIVADPDRACGEYLLDIAARDGAPPLLPQRFWPGAVQDVFRRRALAQPLAPAIVEADQQWSYGELLEASLQLATQLRSDGVGSGDIVAIVATRSASLVVGVLAALQVGAAFSLLNPEYPVKRVGLLAEILQPACIVFAGDRAEFSPPLLERLQHMPMRFVPGRKPDGLDGSATAAFVPAVVEPDALACVTFTSGTTGIPKAVAGVHIGLAGYLSWVPQWLEITASDRFSMLSGLGHDPIQRDMFTPLCNGACLVIPPAEALAPQALASWLKSQRVSFVHMTPALAQILCTTEETRFDDLRVAFLTGEQLRYDLVATLRRFNPAMRILNSYGTTETQRAVTYFEASDSGNDSGAVPASESAADAVIRVLNALGTPCGHGEIGEIYLESHHLSHGYRNDVELTAQVMSLSPDGTGRYRTGDIGCRLADGRVAILGRKDSQLNLRGFRIETGEIEAQARRLDEIREVVVLAMPGESGDPLLVAYVVPRAEDADERVLRTRLADHFAAQLPAFMLPSAIVVLPSLPLTPNGKLDRRALPAPVWSGSADRYVAPRNELETELAAVWAEVLRVERVGIEDNFFELGGHSMLMVLLLSKMRKRLRIPFHPRQILPHATVRAQAEALQASGG